MPRPTDVPRPDRRPAPGDDSPPRSSRRASPRHGRAPSVSVIAILGLLGLLGRTSSVAAQQGEPAPAGAASQHPPGPAVAAPTTGRPAEPFVERIAGTTVSIEFVPLRLVPEPAAPAGQGSAATPAATPATAPAAAPDATPNATPAAAPAPRAPQLWMSAHEITWDAFDVFIHRLDKPDPAVPDALDALVTPSQPFVLADRGYGHAGHPVISANHTLAAAFCAWLSAKTGRRYRLPSHAEWLAAAEAGDPGWVPDGVEALAAVAWVRQNSERRTHAVGSLRPNPWGLYDMLGNAAEWCQATDGSALLAGGSFRDRAQDVGLHSVAHPTPAWNATDPQIPKSRWWLADADFAGFRIVCEE